MGNFYRLYNFYNDFLIENEIVCYFGIVAFTWQQLLAEKLWFLLLFFFRCFSENGILFRKLNGAVLLESFRT